MGKFDDELVYVRERPAAEYRVLESQEVQWQVGGVAN